MFHVEQKIIREWAVSRGVSIAPEAAEMILRYAGKISGGNERLNLTGMKTIPEILSVLMLGSLEPVAEYNVPRGTRNVDIGSGAGVPGIPLAIYFPQAAGVLVESQHKKAQFIGESARDLGIGNVEVLCARAEEIGRSGEYRESFDCAFSRAFGPVYAVIEMGLPLVKEGGFLYIYSSLERDGLNTAIRSHAEILGAEFENSRGAEAPASPPGLLLRKHSPTPERYPRRYAVIERESKKLECAE
jgi:16S rRNA (guanine527-N7)-methyltransferase